MYLKKSHNWLQSWESRQEASQCQSVHTVLCNTCQSSQLVTLSIAFNKHSPPRTPRDGNSSAQTPFETQVAVTEPDEIMAGKDPARPSGAHPLRAGGIPPAAALSTERDFSPNTAHLHHRQRAEPSPDPHRHPAGQTGPSPRRGARGDQGSRARLQGHLAGHRAAGPPPSAPHEPRERRSRRGGLGQARERRGGSGRGRALRHPARPRRGTCREAAPTGSELPGGPPPLLPGPSP